MNGIANDLAAAQDYRVRQVLALMPPERGVTSSSQHCCELLSLLYYVCVVESCSKSIIKYYRYLGILLTSATL